VLVVLHARPAAAPAPADSVEGTYERAAFRGHTWAEGRPAISAMMAGGCHAVDLARHLNDESDIVSASALGVREADGAFANQVALLRFANGGMAKVSACTDQWMPYQVNIDVLGTSGSLRENKISTKALPGVDGWTTFTTVTPTSGLVDDHPFAGEIDHFLDCVMRGHESPTSIRRTANVHRACFAIDASCALDGALVPL